MLERITIIVANSSYSVIGQIKKDQRGHDGDT